jgi:pyruvate formate lyase activating enzyme
MYIKYKQARWYAVLDGNKIECGLCPRKCVIPDMGKGFCGVRKNVDSCLYSLAYGFPVAMQVDPIEKKPFAEFMKGTKTFSIGTYGCNLNCIFCQNYHLSRGKYNEEQAGKYISPELIVELAAENSCASVAFTYNEPTVFAEYCIDVATAAKEKGLAAVLVTNGYITREAAEDLYPLIDAANIDMKGFSEDFYRKMTNSELRPVLDSIKYYYSLKKHLEITNLVIPEKNYSDEILDAWFDWAGKNLDRNVPQHFSAYHPDYKYTNSPATRPEILYRIKEKAAGLGFNHVYLGNIV